MQEIEDFLLKNSLSGGAPSCDRAAMGILLGEGAPLYGYHHHGPTLMLT
ncbi:MAG: hypothetical protein HFJ80_05980 [Clostridiales bacterium]|nr:hypothetical protein [Clostridiales bacterium]